MRLGFYYHIPIHLKPDGNIGMPAFLGRFIDSLAEEVEELILFMHTSERNLDVEYYLSSKNVRVVNLGIKRPAYIRFFFPSIFLKNWTTEIKACDYFLIRSPSPLASAFSNYVETSKQVYMVVGSYREGLKYLHPSWYKAWLVKALNILMHYDFERKLKSKRLIVNSQVLYDAYKKSAKSIFLTQTTTLNEDSFFFNLERCNNPDDYKILYVGRLDLAKGLKESVESISLLRQRGIKATLHLVGWDDTGKVINYLKNLALKLSIDNYIIFHGKKIAGPELFSYYQTSDIYILPSYHEGFPRTIWEAFANSIPVISTSVGSIPLFLQQNVHACLIKPKSPVALSFAIEKIISDKIYRETLIRNAYGMAGNITLKKQSKKIIEFIVKDKSVLVYENFGH